MGASKCLIEHHDDQRRASIEIAIQAGVLRKCEYHSHIIFSGPNNIEDAYRLGNYKYSKGEFGDLFGSRPEMTDNIKRAVEDNHGLESCVACDKVMAD